MSSIELTSSQKTILTALINLFRESESAVKGEDIAEEVNRNPGTIRNQMQSLKALQLVEGVPGPKGGYKPTANAYEALDVDQMDEPAVVPLFHNDERVENTNVDEIDLSSSSTRSTSRASTTPSSVGLRSTSRARCVTSTRATTSRSVRRPCRNS
jgi:hypothetical protein